MSVQIIKASLLVRCPDFSYLLCTDTVYACQFIQPFYLLSVFLAVLETTKTYKQLELCPSIVYM